MKKKILYDNLDRLADNEKSRRFLNHIVNAYFPMEKASILVERPTKKKLVCCLTNQELITVEELMDHYLEKPDEKDAFLKSLEDSLETTTVPENQQLFRVPDGRRLAIASPLTDTFISYEAYYCLFDWIVKKMSTNEKGIGWMTKDVSHDDFIERMSVLADHNPSIKEHLEKISAKKSTHSLGDNDVFKKLKEQFKNNK